MSSLPNSSFLNSKPNSASSSSKNSARNSPKNSPLRGPMNRQRKNSFSRGRSSRVPPSTPPSAPLTNPVRKSDSMDGIFLTPQAGPVPKRFNFNETFLKKKPPVFSLGSRSTTSSPQGPMFTDFSNLPDIPVLLQLPEPQIVDYATCELEHDQVHVKDEIHKLHKHKLDKLTICSVPTEQLRQHVLEVAKNGTRSQIVRMVLGLHQADDEELWLTVLGEDFWREVFEYLDVKDILGSISSVCLTFHHLVNSGDCFRQVDMGPLSHVVQDANMYTLSNKWGTVEELDLSCCNQITNISLQYIATSCKHLRSLTLSECSLISDAGIRLITLHCKDLTVLILDSCVEITNQSLQHINTLRDLVHLELDSCDKITDEGLVHLNLTHLERLTLVSCTNITDYGIRSVAHTSPHLQHLRLELCPDITTLTLQYLSTSCHELLTLGLERTDESHIDDVGVVRLAQGCRSLQYLDLSGCIEVTNASLLKIGQYCSKLERIFLSDCYNISDEGVKALGKGCPSLQSISLARCEKITDISLKALAHCTSLEFLDLSGCSSITDEGMIAILKNCNQLIELYIRECLYLTDKTFEAIMKYAPQIRTLSFGFCVEVSDEGLCCLTACKDLVDLRCEGIPSISDSGIRQLCLDGDIRPEIVHLGQGNAISDVGITTLVENDDNLQELVLRNSSCISNYALHTISENCQNLTVLGLEGLPSVSDEGVEKLMELPSLSQLYVYECNGVSPIEELVKQHPDAPIEVGIYDGGLRTWNTEEVLSESEDDDYDDGFSSDDNTMQY